MLLIELFEKKEGKSSKVLQRYARNEEEIGEAVKVIKASAKRYYGVTECYTVISKI